MKEGSALPTVELDQGTIAYEEVGPPDGRPVVCVHGYLMAGDLWAGLAERLAARGLRVLMPTWPLGAHRIPLRPGADLAPRGVAALIAGLLDALDLRDVVLVGNDSGGALCQVVAVQHPERLGALVLTNCDTFERFPPGLFKALVPLARSARVLRLALAPMRVGAIRRSPLGYGLLSHADIDHLASRWVRPHVEQAGVFEDLRRFTASMHPLATLDAAARLGAFGRPILLAWGADDRLFPLKDAHRLAAAVPGTRVVAIPRSRTLPMLDQPARLAELVAEVAGVPAVA